MGEILNTGAAKEGLVRQQTAQKAMENVIDELKRVIQTRGIP